MQCVLRVVRQHPHRSAGTNCGETGLSVRLLQDYSRLVERQLIEEVGEAINRGRPPELLRSRNASDHRRRFAAGLIA
jgi:hypothetical protein